MIKINESKFDSIKISEIYDYLALEILKRFKHYKRLSKHIDDIVFKFEKKFGDNDEVFKKNIKNYLMKSKIEEIDKTINNFKNNESDFDAQNYRVLTTFFEFRDHTLAKNIFNKLKKTLGEEYNEKIIVLQDKLNECFSNLDDKDTFKKIKDKSHIKLREDANYKRIIELLEYNSEIEKIISYDILTSRQRHDLINAMNMEICPYCNRQFITSWEDDSENFHSTADLDHFYPKSLYPIASLCLHNFIPSCQICNSRFKLAKDFFVDKHLYPYDFGFDDDAKFEIDNIEALIDQTPKFSIHQKTGKHVEEISNSIKTFHLNEVYKSHTNYIEELIERVRIYNHTQIEEYIFGFKGMFNSRDEILLFVFGDILNKNKYDKNPLSKLTCDILENLNIKIN